MNSTYDPYDHLPPPPARGPGLPPGLLAAVLFLATVLAAATALAVAVGVWRPGT